MPGWVLSKICVLQFLPELHSNIKKSDRSLLSDVARSQKRKAEPPKADKVPKAPKMTPEGKAKAFPDAKAKAKAKAKGKAK